MSARSPRRALLSERRRAARERAARTAETPKSAPTWSTTDDAVVSFGLLALRGVHSDTVEELRSAERVRNTANADVHSLVRALREAAAPWAQIADALGTDEQESRRRYELGS